MVTAWKIGPAYRALKNHVPDDRDPILLMHEDDVSRRVPRAMMHLQYLGAETHLVTLSQPTVRHKGFTGGETKLGAPLRQGVEQKAIVLVRPLDRQPQFARMIEFEGEAPAVPEPAPEPTEEPVDPTVETPEGETPEPEPEG